MTKLNNLYLNGNLVASTTHSISLDYDSHPFQIGAEYENEVMDYFFNGKIDDIRIYSRALNEVSFNRYAMNPNVQVGHQ